MARTKTPSRLPLADRLGGALRPANRAALEQLEPLLEDPADQLEAAAAVLARYGAEVVRVVLKEVVPYRGA